MFCGVSLANTSQLRPRRKTGKQMTANAQLKQSRDGSWLEVPHQAATRQRVLWCVVVHVTCNRRACVKCSSFRVESKRRACNRSEFIVQRLLRHERRFPSAKERHHRNGSPTARTEGGSAFNIRMYWYTILRISSVWFRPSGVSSMSTVKNENPLSDVLKPPLSSKPHPFA
jgi:hypothetical protein